ncbi:TolC family protein [Hungatella effluvii]|uniref:TolC family protein n=1 Tax=Hungatella effluvii TaxID=1096246 RepID=UPI002A7FD92A|nr:TolC family protein [Hungatella effluvii]
MGIRFLASAALCAFLTMPAEAGANEAWAAETENSTVAVNVEYDNLRELLKVGNRVLKKSIDTYEDNVAAYEEIWSVMKWRQSDMEDLAEEAEEAGSENLALYTSNAAMLKNSASRIRKQIESLTSEKSTRSLEKSADSYTMAAQTLMNSYNQMVLNIEAQSKSVEVYQASSDETERKMAAGSATQAEAKAAGDRLKQAANSLASLQEQARQLRTQLLTMLGLADDENVSIGSIPAPDLAAIDAVDFEADKAKAIGNSSSVQDARHASAASTAAVNRRFNQVDEAEGTAEADFTETYQEMIVSRTEYLAAAQAYESAQNTYRSLQVKKQAGLLKQSEYLQGEAEYLAAEAAMETASMNLVQAYENYCWTVKGIT